MKAASLFGIIQLIYLTPGIEAARSKEGCYDNYAMTCDHHKVPLEEISFDLEEACYRIEYEILADYELIFFTDVHPEYLNGIGAKDAFCPQMQAAYSHCSFCQGKEFYSLCWSSAQMTICGEKPTRQQLLQDNVKFPQFQSEEDIDNICSQLDYIYSNPQEHKTIPVTYDMCSKQENVKHLCPGECTNTCFDNAPTCGSDPATLSTEMADHGRICNLLGIEYLGSSVEVKPLLNESIRLDYLRAVPKEHELCQNFRESYPHCFWCFGEDDLCFSESRPPSCKPPINKPENMTESFIHDMCSEIASYLPFYPPHPEFIALDKHAKHLSLMKNTPKCTNAQEYYHLCPWCDETIRELGCLTTFPCEINASIPEQYTSKIVADFNLTGQDEEVCGSPAMSSFFFNENFFWDLEVTADKCMNAIAVSRLCPDPFCAVLEAKQRSTNYLGAETSAERKALIWASRVASMLSFFGASYILYNILSDPKSRGTVYYQLLIGMAIFDIVTAFAWSFATAPINKNDPAANHVEGVMGNQATCKAQGFFIQLGFTSVFYNVSLASYYVLVIAHGWKEFQLKKIRRYLHLLPLTLGFGLAFGGLPVYHWIEYACHISPSSQDEGDLWAVLVFVVLPLGLSILAITLSMMVVYNSVRKRSAASRKWSFGIKQASKLEQAVFWQCLFYVLAFYVTWPIMFSVYLFSVDVNGPLGLTMLVAFVAPLQGFNNFLVFVRPKLIKRTESMGAHNARGFLSRLFTAVIPGRGNHSSQPANSGTDEDPPFRGLDPSVAVAMDSVSFSQKLSTRPECPLSRIPMDSNGVEDMQGASKGAVEKSMVDHLGSQLEVVLEGDSQADARSGNIPMPEELPSGTTSQTAASPPKTNASEVESDRQMLLLDDKGNTNDIFASTRLDHHDEMPNVESYLEEDVFLEEGSLIYPYDSSSERKDWRKYLLQSPRN